MICKIEGCEKPVYGRGWCRAHHRRWWRHGDPLAGRTALGEPSRFFEEVVVQYDSDECLIWPYTRNAAGYGHMYINGNRSIVVSRAACERIHGPAPTPEHEAAHSCGMGHAGCCAPRHVRWATISENSADKLIHGTLLRGELCPVAKLTAKNVIEIRRLLKDGMMQRDIAPLFGVSKENISQIARRKTWAWLMETVPGDPADLMPEGEGNG